jgi:hypothetical protein
MAGVNRVEKLIINMDTSLPVTCAWDTCDRRARTTNQVRTHEHPPHWPCGHPAVRHTIYAFCCAGHLDFWVASSGERGKDLAERNQGRIAGMHSPGMKGTIR